MADNVKYIYTHLALFLHLRKIIIKSMPEQGLWQLNHTAQPVQHPSSTVHTHMHTHTFSHTFGLPHQDTVLHTNSGLNSILLGLR